MDDTKIRFGNQFERLTAKIEQAFEEMLRQRPLGTMFAPSECTWTPQIDMCESAEDIFILAEIAGINPEDLAVEVNSRSMKLRGQRRPVLNYPNVTYRVAEVQYGKFERVLHFTAPIDTETVASSYSNGFLRIHLRKRQLETLHKVPIEDG
jgi:HSP20 family protein